MRYVRLMTLVRRQVLRFMRMWKVTLFQPIISSLLFLVIMGMFIGAKMPQINGVSFIEFIIPGLIMLSVITNSYFDSAFGLFLMRWDRFIDELLSSPLSYAEMAMGFLISGASRGIMVGFLVLLASLPFAPLNIAHPILAVFMLVAISAIFSAVGVICAMFSSSFDSLNGWVTFVINPLIFLGGIFHSIGSAPAFLKIATQANPVFYLVDAFRYSMLGTSDGNLMISLAVTVLMLSAGIITSISLFRNGSKLKYD